MRQETFGNDISIDGGKQTLIRESNRKTSDNTSSPLIRVVTINDVCKQDLFQMSHFNDVNIEDVLKEQLFELEIDADLDNNTLADRSHYSCL